MNTKIISMLALAALALVAVPSSQAAESNLDASCDLSEYIAVTDSDSKADAIALADVCSVASGCTTTFVSAESGTVYAYEYRVYNEPVSVKNVVSWHSGLALGTASNTLAFATCAI